VEDLGDIGPGLIARIADASAHGDGSVDDKDALLSVFGNGRRYV
jgi:hypothetical protein